MTKNQMQLSLIILISLLSLSFQLKFTKNTIKSNEKIRTIAFLGNNLLAYGLSNQTIIVYDLYSNEKKYSIQVNAEILRIIRLDDKTFASVKHIQEESLQIWSSINGTLLTNLNTKVVSPIFTITRIDSKTIASIGYDSSIHIWDVITSKKQKTISITYSNFPISLKYIQDSKIAFSGFDSRIRIYNYLNGTLLQTLSGHTSAVDAIIINENRLISSSRDGTIREWDIEKGNEIRRFEEGKYGLYKYLGLALLNNKKYLVSTTSEGISVFDYQTKKLIQKIVGAEFENSYWVEYVNEEIFISANTYHISIFSCEDNV